MSQNQQQLTELSTRESSSQSGEQTRLESGEQEQLVPVTEAIKYRRRAQTAEQQIHDLSEQVKALEAERADSQNRMENVLLERDLTSQLVAAGARDVEVALLLAKEQAKNSDGQGLEISSIVETLRNERPYLFCDRVEEVRQALAGPTAGVRSGRDAGVTSLTRLAEQARTSGNRIDMQEYLRQRRSVVG